MPIVHRIKSVTDFGVLDSFAWKTGVADFLDFNLVYGLNGSGKTTLSRIFRCLEHRRCEKGSFCVTTDSGDVYSTQTSLGEHTLSVRVFNREYVDDTVFVAQGLTSPIYFLGEDSAAKQKEIADLRQKKSALEDELRMARVRRSDAEKALNDFCVSCGDTIREILRVPGKDSYNQYNKTSFRTKCEGIAPEETPTPLADDAFDGLKVLISGTPKELVEWTTPGIPDFESYVKQVDDVMSRAVVSRVIDSLAAQPDVNAWVAQGLALHGPVVETCLFCANPFSPGRRSELEQHFSDQYAALMTDIGTLLESISGEQKAISDLEFPDTVRFYEDLRERWKLSVRGIEEAYREARRVLENCALRLADKKAKPFDISRFPAPQLPEFRLSEAKAIIDEHNGKTRDFTARVEKARRSIEDHYVATYLSEFRSRKRLLEDRTAIVGKLSSDASQLAGRISKLDAEISEHVQPANEINADLAAYLGRPNIRLQALENGYTILRDGKPAERLSEGERTALALIYFLKSLRDKSFDPERSVVVIDDPVSSLDANALFCAYSFIKERTRHAKQLMIFTHNFAMFKLVRKWFGHYSRSTKKENHRSRFFMLGCDFVAGARRASLKDLDPLLHRYQSEYHYLFAQVVEGSERDKGEMEKFYHYPNIARRVLESFLAFRYPESAHDGADGKMHELLERTGFDKVKCGRIHSFLNVHSHEKSVDASGIHDDSILLETPSVLRDLLELLRHEDPKHVAAMESLIREGEA